MEKLKAFKSASVALLQGGTPGDAGERAVSIDKQDKKVKKDKKHKKDKKAKKRARDSDGGGGPEGDGDGAATDREDEAGKADKPGQKKSGNTEVLHALPLGFQSPSGACSEADRSTPCRQATSCPRSLVR